MSLKKYVLPYILGFATASACCFFIGLQWAKKEVTGAFDLGVASGEAGYINMFSRRLEQDKEIAHMIELSVCLASFELSQVFERNKQNTMINPAYVVIPDAIRHSDKYKSANGLASFEACGMFIKEKYNIGS